VTRKLLIRVIGAPILLAALFAVFYLDDRQGRILAVRFLLAGAVGLGMIELIGMIRKRGYPVAPFSSVVLLLLPFLPWSWLLGRPVPELFTAAATLFVLCLLLKLVLRSGAFTIEGAALAMGSYGYLSLLQFGSFPPGRIPAADFTWYLLFLVAANKGSDMAAFVAGKSIGRHKMTPVLSPNKTWEGAIAGGIVGSGSAFAFLRWSPLHSAFLSIPDWCLLSLSIFVTIASQLGDLVESAFKRWAGVKDSGRLIPEFGGVLDMIDSFILSVPVAYGGCEFLMRVYP
jgi:phosphatidate cytidylyltransferase